MEFTDSSSFERLTGLAFFTPAGDTGAISFGNILMLKQDYGLTTRDLVRSIRGQLQPRQRIVTGRLPVYSITGDQFATPLVPLQLLGEQLDDWIQTTATAATFTFTATPGRSYYVGAWEVTIATVKVGSVTKTLGTDYSFDALNGWLSLPVDAGTINAGDVVVVTFNAPGMACEQYSAFTTLSRDGTLVVYAEDEYGPPAIERWTLQVTLTCKAAADTQPAQFREWTMEALVYGNPQVLKRRENAADESAIEELLFDDSSIMGLG